MQTHVNSLQTVAVSTFRTRTRTRTRNSVNRLAVLSILVLSAFTQGCTLQPWVRHYERQHLAEPMMSFQRDSNAAGFMTHILESREGARGAQAGGGGGCGCN
jgi:hypothetical protein